MYKKTDLVVLLDHHSLRSGYQVQAHVDTSRAP